MKRLWPVLLILLVMLGVDAFVSLPHHDGAAWQHLPGAYGIFGFVFCLVLIVTGKTLGKMGLLQGETDDD